MKISITELKALILEVINEQETPMNIDNPEDDAIDFAMMDDLPALPYKRRKKEDLSEKESQLRMALIYRARDGSKTAGRLLKKLMTDKWTTDDMAITYSFLKEV